MRRGFSIARIDTEASSGVPTLVVHGLWDTNARIQPLVDGLCARGIQPITSFDLIPNDGRAPIPELAHQVRTHADQLRLQYARPRIDLVGFSMGGLAARYYLQRCGGVEHVRRFISISGPQHGTLTAYGLPLIGVRQMRPGSALLTELAADPDPWGTVQVHCLYTPFDLMIVPAVSSVLPGAHTVHRIPVPIHRWMMRDPRVLDLVAQLLRAPMPMTTAVT